MMDYNADCIVAHRVGAVILVCALISTGSIVASADEADVENVERKFHPGHYVALEMSDDGPATILDVLKPGVQGVQMRYTWRELEPREDHYDFSAIEADLTMLQSVGKQLVVFVFDKSFRDERYTPEYLWQSYTLPIRSAKPGKGFVAKRWDPYVVDRMSRLLVEIGRQFDGHPHFEGLAIQESALGVVDTVLDREEYSASTYRDALVEILKNARHALPDSQVFWYMNYLARGQSLLSSVLVAVEPYDIVVGGPDVLPDSVPLRRHVYPLMISQPSRVQFISAQNDSFRHEHAGLDAATKYWTPNEVFEFARGELGVQYLFWNRVTLAKPADSYDIEDAYPVMFAHPHFNGALPSP